MVDVIGIAEIKPDRAKLVADKIGADFVIADYRELLARPEVTAVVVATDEHLHIAPVLDAAERGLCLFIEKPLATELGCAHGNQSVPRPLFSRRCLDADQAVELGRLSAQGGGAHGHAGGNRVVDGR